MLLERKRHALIFLIAIKILIAIILCVSLNNFTAVFICPPVL